MLCVELQLAYGLLFFSFVRVVYKWTLTWFRFSLVCLCSMSCVWILGHGFVRRFGEEVAFRLDQLHPGVKVHVKGIGGSKVRDVGDRLWLHSPAPELILLHVGEDDVLDLSPSALVSSLLQKVDMLHEETGAMVLVVPLHPRVQPSPQFRRYNDLAKQVNRLLRFYAVRHPGGHMVFPRFNTAVNPNNTGNSRVSSHFDSMGVHPVGVYQERYLRACVAALRSRLN